MPKIPTAQLDHLRQAVSVVRLAESQGVKLKRQGKQLLGSCPFHEDKTPSLFVDPAANLFNCLGACGKGGGPIDWVMMRDSCSFRQAANQLLTDFPLAASSAASPAGSRRSKSKNSRGSARSAARGDAANEINDAQRLNWVANFYHASLNRSDTAKAYLAKRGIDSEHAINHFKLGFSNRTLGYQLPKGQTAAGKRQRGQLQRLGILRKSGHEHLNGSLVVPLFDENGDVVQMYGRKIRDDLRKGTPTHLYLPGPHRGIFNREALNDHSHIILCESILDALTFWCAGLQNVTACFGVNGFTAELRQALSSKHIKQVTIAFDRDDAGQKAATKIGKELVALGKSVAIAKFPRGLDANEYALKVKPAEQSLALVINSAEWIGGGRKAEAQQAAMEAANVSGEAKAAPTVQPEKPSSSLAAVAPATSTRKQLREEAQDANSQTLPNTAAPSQPAPPAPMDRDVPSKATAPSDAGDVRFRYGDRLWRVRGLARNERRDIMKVNLFVSRSVEARDGGAFHVDNVELYNARQRTAFIKQASLELGCEERVIKRDIGRVLLALEERQEKARAAERGPQTNTPTLTDAERNEALKLLRDPNLLKRIVADIDACGIVGEQSNKLIGYLAAVSRKLDRPLAVVIQSSSAAGKSSLMEAILSMIPQEDRIQYSAMTGQSLFYMGEQNLKHKILAIVEEEGAERASYALKLLQSEGELTIASTGKDPQTGRHITQEYHVEGPVMIMLTTTAIDIDEELLNRCLVLTVDEGHEQTSRIHQAQRHARTLEGQFAKKRYERLVKLHQNAQRLLRPVAVVNPFANKLTFYNHKTRFRRDHAKYLTLIETIALLHQHQRTVKTAERNGQRLEYIEVLDEDIKQADKLFATILDRTLDELPPQTRRLFGVIVEKVVSKAEHEGMEANDVRFTRREVRDWCQMGNTQVHTHLSRLEELEYVLAYRPGIGRRVVYCLLYDSRNWQNPSAFREPFGGGDRKVFSSEYMHLGQPFGLSDPHCSLERENRGVVGPTVRKATGR